MKKTSKEWEYLFTKYGLEGIMCRDYSLEWVTPSKRESKTNGTERVMKLIRLGKQKIDLFRSTENKK